MIILTGGAGFIGSALLAKLNSIGINDVFVVDNIARTEKWKNLLGKSFLDYIHKDNLLNRLESGNFTKKPDVIFHLGACSSTTEMDSDYLMENNYQYSKRLAEYSLKNDIRFIYASSAATYGDGKAGFSDDHAEIKKFMPLNPYGYSKQLFDQWALQSGAIANCIGFKFFNVFGPNEYHKEEMKSVVFKATQQAKKTGAISLFKSYNPKYNDGEQVRDFVYVKDVVETLWKAVENPKVNGIFNLGSGKAQTWNELAESVFLALNLEVKINYIPMPEALIKSYQYYTKAQMQKLQETPVYCRSSTLQSSISDYVSNYLKEELVYL